MQLVLESLPFRAVFIMHLVLESMQGVSRLCAGYGDARALVDPSFCDSETKCRRGRGVVPRFCLGMRFSMTFGPFSLSVSRSSVS